MTTKPIPIPPTPASRFAVDVVRRLRAAGFEALWAGGCVRDLLLGLEPKDYDVASSARPSDVAALFRKTVAVGESFGVVRVVGPRPIADGPALEVEVAAFRSDGVYTDGRRPDAVVYSDPREDALRRDFTINGLFLDPETGRIDDYVGGRADLAAGVVRAVGDPVARFTEDKLRLLRAVRFAARFGFALDERSAAAVKAMAGQLRVVSPERILMEARAMLEPPTRLAALDRLVDLGLFAGVFPLLAHLPQDAERWATTRRLLADWPTSVPFPLAVAGLLATEPDVTAETAAEEIFRDLRAANDERERCR
ncbi:MAG: CCA tRNA nucleotidyltransferase, partial [Planctomycetia bacterium]